MAEPEQLAHRPHNRSTRFVWGAVVVILIGVIAIVVYALAGPPESNGTVRRAPTSAAVMAELAGIPPSVFDAVGVSTAAIPLTAPTVVDGAPVSAGKPEVLYVGAEFCPFCAAERWPLIVALSRFGRFTALTNMQSAASSVFPGTQSFSFVGAIYSSRYLTFTGIELYSDAVGTDGTYARIADLTPTQSALLSRYAGQRSPAGDPGAYPFVDIAGLLVTSTSGFSPGVLAGLSQSAIAGALDQAKEPSTQAIVASANYLTAGICRATHGQPVPVCTSKGVRSAAAALQLGTVRPTRL